MLGTSRANPTKSDDMLDQVLENLRAAGIDKLVTIGGDDTSFTCSRLAERSEGTLSVAHVPKTIDNDLDLPPNIDTFGYQTARHVGVGGCGRRSQGGPHPSPGRAAEVPKARPRRGRRRMSIRWHS